ncbi:prostaglandin reductase 3-like [Oppia nitens]|uniref:prostaglandin reductase 3-like n=1 Tax=Oppia nitens TaxID=1686743 RepID=UPI0023DB87DB|nr:prostaglandin reductase 3-like [Oppia nitens]
MSKTFKKLSVVKKTANFREAVKVVDVPLVPPTDDQILVKVVYAGVNATDINITAARYFTDGKLPFDIGLEALGLIEAIGKNVSNFKVGQPVVSFGVTPKAYSEYLYAKADELVPIPSIKPEFLSLFVCGLTATTGLDEAGRIKSGEKVLITASAGGTGHIAVQWAKQKGCYVIGMTSSTEKAKLLKELGTDRVINYKTENLDEVLTKEFPNGIDVIWETIGGKTYETLFNHLAPKGRLVIVGGITGYQTEGFLDIQIPNLNTKLLMGNKSLTGYILSGFNHLFPEYLTKLIGDVVNNKLKIVIDLGQNTTEGEFKGIDGVVRGVEHLHSGRNIGKVIIKIQDH